MLHDIFLLTRPDRFLLSDLMDWMHEVMDKDAVDWRYSRSDLRIFFIPFLKGYALEKMPFGQKWLRAATIDKLERVIPATSVMKGHIPVSLKVGFIETY